MTQPLISVIIPCFNDGGYLQEAIDSAFAMDYPALEVILVDDGSSDPATGIAIKNISQARPQLRVLRLPENRGLAAARNAGIAAANGDFILPLDCDNRLLSTYARKAVDVFLRDSNVGVVYGNAVFFGDRTGIWSQPDFELLAMLDFNQIDACAVFRHSVWVQAGGYEETLFKASWEDWDFWLSACERGWAFHHLHETVFAFRSRNDSLSSRTRDAETRLRLYKSIYQRHKDLYLQAWLDLLLLKADRDWGVRDQQAYIQKLEHELGEALKLQRDIRWLLTLRTFAKRLLRWPRQTSATPGELGRAYKNVCPTFHSPK